MDRNDLIRIASMNDSEISCCKILRKNKRGISFVVDENLQKQDENLGHQSAMDIVSEILKKEQIDEDLYDVVCTSMKDYSIYNISNDVLYKTVVTCYAEHRPLVLTPDVIWIIVAQGIAKQINSNPEHYRKLLVSHDGQMDLLVKSKRDIWDEKIDWNKIFEQFYKQIDKNTNHNFAERITGNFSTTGPAEKIASTITLMKGVESYFRYHIIRYVCGIPHIELKGSAEDWVALKEKSKLLMDFDLQEWYDWLQPIFDEFIRTAQGLPNAEFWKSIVMKYVPFAFSGESRGCIPDFTELDGWVTALFPNKYDDVLRYNKAYKDQNMGSEMVRVGFKYERVYPNGEVETFPMELWAGIIGVHENKNTFGLEPKIGWFVRKSHEKDESLARLNGQNNHRGLELTVREVPEILKEIFSIKSLELKFTDGIVLPDWMEGLKIEGDFRVFGKISRQEAKELKAKYKGIKINPKY